MATGVAIAAGIASSMLSSRGAEKAASEQAGAAESAANLGLQRYLTTRSDLSPFTEAGQKSIQEQAALSGALGPEAEVRALQAFQESPGQAFLRRRAERALIRNQAAIGGLGGGNIRKALQEQAIGFAQQDFANRFNRLGAVSGAGLQAAGQLANIGSVQAQQQGSLLQQAGEARAGGILDSTQAFTSGLSGLTGILGAEAERRRQQEASG